MEYDPQVWNDGPMGNTPTSSGRLNHMEAGIYGASRLVVVQETNPGLTDAGIWIQTGLGADGQGFTFWFEDGVTP